MIRFAEWKKSLPDTQQMLVDYLVNAVLFAGLHAIFYLLIDDRPLTLARVVFGGIFFSLVFTSSKKTLTWKQLGSLFKKRSSRSQ